MIKLIFTDNNGVMILKEVNNKMAKVSVPPDARIVKRIKRILEKIWKNAQMKEKRKKGKKHG